MGWSNGARERPLGLTGSDTLCGRFREPRSNVMDKILAFCADVRRQGFWGQWLRKLRESLAHLVGLMMRRATAAPTGYYAAASTRRENSVFGDMSYKPIGTASGFRPVRIIMPRPTRLVSTVSLAKRPPVNVPKAGNIRCSCPIKNAGRVAFLSRAFGW